MYRKIFSRQSPNLDLRDFTAILKVIKAGEIFSGQFLEEFGSRFSEYTGIKHIAMVNMGRTAELVALKALDFSEGDEIIMPSYNFPIVPILVKVLGLKTVFVDIEPDTFNIDCSKIEENITSKTKAIFITHMCGHPCEMDTIMELKNKYGLKLIEDAVHSLGAEYKNQKVGTFGDVSYFSFYVGKTMTTFMGAAVGTNDSKIFEKIQDLLSVYKRLALKELTKVAGYGTLTYFLTNPVVFSLTVYPFLIFLNIFNSHFLDEKMEESLFIPQGPSPEYLTKFTNLQAALGLSQLEKLDTFISKRMKNSFLLNENIEADDLIKLPVVQPYAKHTFLYYFLRAQDRDTFRKKLIFRGIDTKRDSNRACSHLKIFKEERKYCPVSEKVACENTLIPNYPSLSMQDILYIAHMINQVAKEMKK